MPKKRRALAAAQERVWALCFLFLAACVHDLRIHSRDGQELKGKYRFAREDTGLIQIRSATGEVLNGKFVRVARAAFVAGYEQTFGRGSIATYGPDLAAYGNPFAGMFGTSSALSETAFGETFDSAGSGSQIAVRGPLFYWTASLRGDRGTTMGCFLIGSSYTGHGFGKCKSDAGNEYSFEF
jgi:hypothetical protein